MNEIEFSVKDRRVIAKQILKNAMLTYHDITIPGVIKQHILSQLWLTTLLC